MSDTEIWTYYTTNVGVISTAGYVDRNHAIQKLRERCQRDIKQAQALIRFLDADDDLIVEYGTWPWMRFASEVDRDRLAARHPEIAEGTPCWVADIKYRYEAGSWVPAPPRAQEAS